MKTKTGTYARRHGRPSARNRQRARRAKEAGLTPAQLAVAQPSWGRLILPPDADGLQGQDRR